MTLTTPYVSKYVTSPETSGLSTAILKLDDEMKRYLAVLPSAATRRLF